METSFSDANILNIFSAGSLLPGHTVQLIRHLGVSLKENRLNMSVDCTCSLAKLALDVMAERKPTER